MPEFNSNQVGNFSSLSLGGLRELTTTMVVSLHNLEPCFRLNTSAGCRNCAKLNRGKASFYGDSVVYCVHLACFCHTYIYIYTIPVSTLC